MESTELDSSLASCGHLCLCMRPVHGCSWVEVAGGGQCCPPAPPCLGQLCFRAGHPESGKSASQGNENRLSGVEQLAVDHCLLRTQRAGRNSEGSLKVCRVTPAARLRGELKEVSPLPALAFPLGLGKVAAKRQRSWRSSTQACRAGKPKLGVWAC
uniref:Uncharacterized protein n=1 Tax=Myotis myotis TaxID=51298 RepID=A0A7J7XZY4_MYOMY|nr:hypothetical protein mMyoMyo1_011493 [Myotis myotis]